MGGGERGGGGEAEAQWPDRLVYRSGDRRAAWMDAASAAAYAHRGCAAAVGGAACGGGERGAYRCGRRMRIAVAPRRQDRTGAAPHAGRAGAAAATGAEAPAGRRHRVRPAMTAGLPLVGAAELWRAWPATHRERRALPARARPRTSVISPAPTLFTAAAAAPAPACCHHHGVYSVTPALASRRNALRRRVSPRRFEYARQADGGNPIQL